VLSHGHGHSRGVCIGSGERLGLPQSTGSIPCTELAGVWRSDG
jgi:hypothetical protein